MGVELERSATSGAPDVQSTDDFKPPLRPTYLRLAAREDSRDISTIGIQPPLNPEQTEALVEAMEFYDIQDFLADSFITVRPADGDPYTELDLERLGRRTSEEGLAIAPLNLARHMRDTLGRLGPVQLDEEIRELGPKDYMFDHPDVPLPAIDYQA
jgi:hypothetical protein